MAAMPAHAAESYDNCTGFIDSIPAVVSTQGTWCLRKDVSSSMTSGMAITIATNNVTIDCNDFKIGGLAAGVGTGVIGISAQERDNSTIRNCNIRGFLYGVTLILGAGHAVENNRFDGNTFVAALVDGDGSRVSGNQIRDTGNTTGFAGYAAGIHASQSVDISNNTIIGVLPRTDSNGNANSHGIRTDDNATGSVRGNRISGIFSSGNGLAYGIQNRTSGRVSVIDNQVIGDMSPGSIGVWCTNSNGRARDNMINGAETGLVGCRDDGNSL